MRIATRLFSVAVLVTGSMGGPAGASGEVSARTPHVDVELIASRTAVVPGEPIELAVRFELEQGWHIYWRNRGEGGLEPSFKWRLPDGFTAGPVRFPAPTRHVDRAGSHTFVLEGAPTLLAEVKVPAALEPGGRVTFGVGVTWLVCRQACHLAGNPVYDGVLNSVDPAVARFGVLSGFTVASRPHNDAQIDSAVNSLDTAVVRNVVLNGGGNGSCP